MVTLESHVFLICHNHKAQHEVPLAHFGYILDLRSKRSKGPCQEEEEGITNQRVKIY